MGQQGFWDFSERHEKLAKQKGFLVELDELVPWEVFRPSLERLHEKPRKSSAGRKPIDDELEYQVNDRLSFMRFLHLGLEDKVPDSKTVWLFKEQLRKAGLVEELFEQFASYLNGAGYQAQCGQIVDATLVPVPKQRNSKRENDQVKRGEVPEDWQNQPHKLSQKDTDARWTKKRGVSYYGYKNHISRDAGHGFIRRYRVTDAALHDSKVLGHLLDADNSDDDLWGDSAYLSAEIVEVLSWMGFISHINERAYRNRPLTDEQTAANRERSKTRAKVEHVFGAMVNEMGGKAVRTIGIARATVMLGLKNLTYNLKQFVFWQRQEELTELAA